MSAPKSAATKAKAKGGLRAALAAKTTRTVPFDIPVVPSRQADQAAERLTRVKGQLELARLSKEPEVIERLEEQLVVARADRDACFHRVEFAALGSNEWDAFLNEHQQPDDADDEAKKAAEERFRFDLLVAAIVDGDSMTAEEWRTELSDEDKWPAPDARALHRAVLEAQQRDFSDGIPKD